MLQFLLFLLMIPHLRDFVHQATTCTAPFASCPDVVAGTRSSWPRNSASAWLHGTGEPHDDCLNPVRARLGTVAHYGLLVLDTVAVKLESHGIPVRGKDAILAPFPGLFDDYPTRGLTPLMYVVNSCDPNFDVVQIWCQDLLTMPDVFIARYVATARDCINQYRVEATVRGDFRPGDLVYRGHPPDNDRYDWPKDQRDEHCRRPAEPYVVLFSDGCNWEDQECKRRARSEGAHRGHLGDGTLFLLDDDWLAFSTWPIWRQICGLGGQ